MIWWWLAGILGLPIVLSVGLRPWYLFRGLTNEEKLRRWPGDDVLPGAMPSGSRGITIEVSAAQVWPWLTQIGQDRAGFYSYQWLENLAGAKMPDVREIRPEWSTREKGDLLVMAPPARFGKIATMPLVEIVAGKHLVYHNREGTWAFILVPIGPDTCRLIARGTWLPPKNPIARLLHGLLFDPIHYIMEWKMLRSIKALAEAASP